MVVLFPEFKDFRPNKTPKQVFNAGAFGGTYYRPIDSSITNKSYTSKQAMEGFKDWFSSIDIETMVISENYDKHINKYKVKCGSSLEEWEKKRGSDGKDTWIVERDPYGWFQWYCQVSNGRIGKTPKDKHDDERQIKRWLGVAGPNGRFRRRLMNKIIKENKEYNDYSISPVIRQVLLHWGYELTKKDFEKYKESKQ